MQNFTAREDSEPKINPVKAKNIPDESQFAVIDSVYATWRASTRVE
jgi:hypothetical protein